MISVLGHDFAPLSYTGLKIESIYLNIQVYLHSPDIHVSSRAYPFQDYPSTGNETMQSSL